MDLRSSRLHPERGMYPWLWLFDGQDDRCGFFAMQAARTWFRIGFSRAVQQGRTRSAGRRLAVTEETITEDLLLDFHYLSSQMQHHGLQGVDFFEAVNEPRDGNDIGLIVQYAKGACYFHIQSKILDGSYQGMWKYDAIAGGGRLYQIDKLIQSCPRYVNCFPLYLLYNHVSPIAATTTICGHDVDEFQYGCTVADARSMLIQLGRPYPYKRRPRFDQLHDIANHQTSLAHPWMKLICCDHTTISSVHDLLKQESTFDETASLLKLAAVNGELTIPFWDANANEELRVSYRKVSADWPVKGERDLEVNEPNGEMRPAVFYPKILVSIRLEFPWN